MAKAPYSDDKKSVTYRGKTFRVGDKVKVYRDTGLCVGPIIGQTVEILAVGNYGEAVLCEEKGGKKWGVPLEDLFEYSEEDEPHQAQPERKPWDMPELKSGMRVVGQFSTHLVAEVNGNLFGVCEHGWAVVGALYEIAVEVYGPPTEDADNPWAAMCTAQKGKLLWSRKEAEKQRQAHEAKEARRQEIQAEIDKLKTELRGLDGK